MIILSLIGKYIIEGHHRFAASQQTGVNIDIVFEQSGPIGMNDWSGVTWKEFISENQFWGN